MRVVNPCATYSTMNITIEAVTSATGSAGLPASSAGSVNPTMVANAPTSPAMAASPRHRATSSTTSTNAAASSSSGTSRSKSTKM